jgi:predicted aspartyl protease
MSTTVDRQEPVVSETVRFRLAGGRNPLILVPVYVDGKGPFEFILDTGASHCLLSPELSESLGVRHEFEKQAMGAAGPVTIAFGRVASLAVGSTQQENIQVAVTGELNRIAAAIGDRVDGALGFEFLRHLCLTVDYRAGTLCLATPKEIANQRPPGRSIPFELAAAHKPLVVVQVMVDGQGPFSFALDTGASRTMMSSELAGKLAVPTTEDGPATGGGGQIRILAGEVNSIAVGDAIVRDHAIGVGDFFPMLSAAVGKKLNGILGYNFLNQFRVTIDYSRRILELEPTVLP